MHGQGITYCPLESAQDEGADGGDYRIGTVGILHAESVADAGYGL